MIEDKTAIIDNFDSEEGLLPSATRASIVRALEMGRVAAIIMGSSLVISFLLSSSIGAGVMLFALIFNLLLAYPVVRLYQATQKIPKSFEKEDEYLLHEGFSNLKSSFKLHAILVALLIAVLIIFGIPSLIAIALS